MILENRYHKRMDIHLDIHIMHRGRHIQATAKNITPNTYCSLPNYTQPLNQVLKNTYIPRHSAGNCTNGLTAVAMLSNMGGTAPHLGEAVT